MRPITVRSPKCLFLLLTGYGKDPYRERDLFLKSKFLFVEPETVTMFDLIIHLDAETQERVQIETKVPFRSDWLQCERTPLFSLNNKQRKRSSMIITLPLYNPPTFYEMF